MYTKVKLSIVILAVLLSQSSCSTLPDSLEDDDMTDLDDQHCAEICVPNSGPCECNKAKGHIICTNERLKTANLCTNDRYSQVTFKVVQLDSNDLTFLKAGSVFPEIAEDIAELDLSNNQLKELPYGMFKDFVKLEELSLGQNRLSTINMETFHYLDKLEALDLRHNDITDLTDHPFVGVNNLCYLYLDSNPIRKINDDTFVPLTKLLMLSIDNADLSSIEESWLKPMINLKTLSLNRNRLLVLPDIRLPTLEILSMANNKFTEIRKNSFEGLQNLQVLRLSDQNDLWLVDDCAFCHLPKLLTMELAHCPKLTSFSTEAFGKTLPTAEVDLSGNALTTLARGSLSDWKKVKMVRLEDNRWNCDCDIMWIAEIQESQDTVTKCASPPEHEGKDIRLLHPQDLGCSNPGQHPRARVYVVLLLLILLASGAAFSWFVWPGKKTFRDRCLPYRGKRPAVPQYTYNNLATDAQGDYDKMGLVTDDVLQAEHERQNGRGPEPVML